VLDGRRAVGDRPGNRTLLVREGIDFIEGEVRSMKVEEKVVEVGNQKFAWDLIIALGVD
jgi:NADH dehydrogenase FAD-containing subunit